MHDTVAYQALVWFLQARPQSRQECPCPSLRSSVRARCPACCGPLPSGTATRPAYVEGDRTLSFTELLEQVRAVARGYVALGLEPGDRVVVWAPNSIDWVVAGLAVSYAGATLVPANSRYTGHEVADIVDRTGASLVLVADGFLDRTQIADLQASQRPRLGARGGRPRQPRLGEPARRRLARGRGRGARRRGLPRRRRGHPVHLRDHRASQGRDERAPADHRGGRRVEQPRRGLRGGPLPRGEPVLPLLRLQDRHRRRAADRRHALPRRQLRPGRDDAADPGRADHGAAGCAHDLPVAAHRAEPLRRTTCPRCASPSRAPRWCPWS